MKTKTFFMLGIVFGMFIAALLTTQHIGWGVFAIAVSYIVGGYLSKKWDEADRERRGWIND